MEEIPAPKGLKPGFYDLVASYDPKFPNKKGRSRRDPFLGQRPVPVMKVSVGDGMIQGFVLDARSGEPIEGGDVRTWLWNRFSAEDYTAGPTGKTDQNGLFSLPIPDSMIQPS